MRAILGAALALLFCAPAKAQYIHGTDCEIHADYAAVTWNGRPAIALFGTGGKVASFSHPNLGPNVQQLALDVQVWGAVDMRACSRGSRVGYGPGTTHFLWWTMPTAGQLGLFGRVGGRPLPTLQWPRSWAGPHASYAVSYCHTARCWSNCTGSKSDGPTQWVMIVTPRLR